MKVHKIVLIVIDFDEIHQAGVIDVIENTKYPNRCINPKVISATTRDCGEWDDDHPLNKTTLCDAYLDRLFGTE